VRLDERTIYAFPFLNVSGPLLQVLRSDQYSSVLSVIVKHDEVLLLYRRRRVIAQLCALCALT
jgi:hypothetical protein